MGNKLNITQLKMSMGNKLNKTQLKMSMGNKLNKQTQHIQNKKAKQCSLLHSLHGGGRTPTAARECGLTQSN